MVYIDSSIELTHELYYKGADEMPKRIIHIDRDQDTLEMVRTCLEECGYLVVSCSSTTEYHSAIEEVPDLIITELAGKLKPESKSGWELHNERNSDPKMREVPVMALTALPENRDVFRGCRGWQSGIVCYLTKPINCLEVVTFVKRIFESLE